jgi:hypothetical protein
MGPAGVDVYHRVDARAQTLAMPLTTDIYCANAVVVVVMGVLSLIS